jgi:hypothetical protein
MNIPMPTLLLVIFLIGMGCLIDNMQHKQDLKYINAQIEKKIDKIMCIKKT